MQDLNRALQTFFSSSPVLASPSPPPPPASFPVFAVVPTNASNHGLVLQLTTACKPSYGVSSPRKADGAPYLERYEWVKVRYKSYESECHDMYLVVCQMWGEVVRVGLPLSSASFLREHLCAENRPLQAQTIRRDYAR